VSAAVLSTAGEVTWPALIADLIAGTDLDRAKTAWAMNEMMSGNASPVQLAGFLVALRAKGETVEELSGLVDVMLRHAVRIEVPGRCVDVVGTGGDRSHSVNISTMASLVVAGAGVRVVKHGNRAASSASGAADVLEALGVRLDLAPERVAEVASEVGITFCFAQVFHPAMRHAGPVRAGLGVPTVFNVLGPLTNPAQPTSSAVGVANPAMAPLVAGVFAERGASVLVFRGEDGLDELSTTSPAQVWEVRDGGVVTHRLDARELGLRATTLADLRGGDATFNAKVVRSVLAGEPGPVRDTVLLNAAAALVAADAEPGAASLEERLVAGLARAATSVDSGAAAEVLDRWVAATGA
jgi:anthranilate phosphoribosyltransferase